MSPPRPDPLDVIYEDDETDEGAISADGGTSLHGHPDHEHADEDLRALAAENELLRENVNALVREVACADAEMVRWRSRCRKIEDERDALSRELDRCKVELERRHARPQSMVVYSTAESVPRLEQQQPPMYHSGNNSGAGQSPPPRFASPRMRSLSPGPVQGYGHTSLPSIAVSPTYDPTPPGVGVPTHRGRLAPPRTAPSPKPRSASRERERERKREFNRWEQAEQSRLQERERNHLSREQTWLAQESSVRFEKAQRDREQAQRELEQAQQEWEHVQYSREQEQNPSPVVYSTGTPEGWSYFDIPRQNERWNPSPSASFAPSSQSTALPSPTQQSMLVYSSAYPHPNGHGQGRHVQEEGLPGRNAAQQDTVIMSPRQAARKAQSPLRSQVQLQPQPLSHIVISDRSEPRRTPANEAPSTPAAPGSSSSQGSASSAGSHDAPPGDAPPRTPPDPAPAPAAFTFSPTSAAFSPTGLHSFTAQTLTPTSPPFQPVVDPEFGPVIVHGPLPPRHTHVAPPAPAPQRRKREPASVPPRHLAGGKGAFGGAAFGGAAMGMGGGVTLSMAGSPAGGDGWAWSRR